MAPSSASGRNPKPKKKATSAQSRAVKVRWDARGKSDLEVRDHFLNIDHATGLDELSTLRRHVEIASVAYNENVQREQTECCANPKCKRPFSRTQLHYRKRVIIDPVTKQPRNVMTCCQACENIVWGNARNPVVPEGI